MMNDEIRQDYENRILANSIALLEKDREIAGLKNAIAELTAMVNYLKEQQKLSMLRRFGASSEKTPHTQQVSIFDAVKPEGAGPLFAQVAPGQDNPGQGGDGLANGGNENDNGGNSPQTETITYTRKKQKGKREADLSKLETEIIEYNIPESSRPCPDCGERMVDIGKDDRSEVTFVAAKLVHTIHRRQVCKCNNCSKNSHRTPIIKADAPLPLIPGSIASASLVSHIITQKYLMHLPLYRQAQEFARQGVPISRQNMSNWITGHVAQTLSPVYSHMVRCFLTHDIIHSDDSRLQVLKEPGKPAESMSVMWLYRTSGDSKTPIVLYEYQPDRKGEHPRNFLAGPGGQSTGGFKGYCHTDGFAGYNNIGGKAGGNTGNNVGGNADNNAGNTEGIIIVGCWAHARRKFNDAYCITKAEDSPAKIGLDYCNKLFELERGFTETGMTADDRHKARQTLSLPLAQEFYAWAKSQHIHVKTATTTAITYLLNQEQRLMNVFLDGRLELSNNRAERSIKPFVMGRKNWLFSNTPDGARSSAIIYSIIETAKENWLKPFEYIQFLLETLPDTPMSRVDGLMPWGDRVPEGCYVAS